MKILIGYEKFGRVREEFRKRGHNAWSCDLESDQSDAPHTAQHLMCDFWEAYRCMKWDMVIGFPVCTYVCGSGLHWNKNDAMRRAKTDWWMENFRRLLQIKEPFCWENPIGALSRIRKPTQIIQPWWYGDDASKATCLWLQNLPKLDSPTNGTYACPDMVLPRLVEWPKGSGVVRSRWGNQTDSGQNKLGPSAGRAAERGKTYMGIARAMAATWG